MLVLTRRTGDSIVIGGHVVVTILDVRGDVVRVGVEAPRDIQVHRAEVFEAVQEANRAAALADDTAAEALRGLVEQRAVQPQQSGGSNAQGDTGAATSLNESAGSALSTGGGDGS